MYDNSPIGKEFKRRPTDITRFLNRLFILDLDHTLIYASYEKIDHLELLFHYPPYLRVYCRPYARSFIETLSARGDILVCTSSKKEYAREIVKCLSIRAISVITRESCRWVDDHYKKVLPPVYHHLYNSIYLIDDSPYVWEKGSLRSISILMPTQFWGEKEDMGLRTCREEICNLFL